MLPQPLIPDLIKERLQHGLIVSCHNDAHEPFHSLELVLAYAQAAELGGAAGLRVSGVETVSALRKSSSLPIIAFTSGRYADGSELITPELEDIEALSAAGATIIAVDATKRKRPNDKDGFIFFEEARKIHAGLLWADCATFREGVKAAESGADFVATTLSGYTPGTETRDYRSPDYGLIQELSSALTIPVIAEGRIWSPESARHAMEMGAYAVVVGSAITRPKIITRMFVEALK